MPTESWLRRKTLVSTLPNQCDDSVSFVHLLFSKQTQMPSVQPPVCLLGSPPATATSQMMAQTSSPNKDARLPPSSLSWTVPIGKGYCSYWTDNVQDTFFLKAVFWTWFNSKGCLLFLFLDKRCAVGLSIRVDLERWSLILDCSSPAAAPKSRRHWHPHKWPHAFPTRFLHSSQKTWKKPGDCFC